MVDNNSPETNRTAFQPTAFQAALHLFALSAFAVAWPIYDLLSRHAGFLVAHRATATDLGLLVFVVSFGIPAALFIFWFVASRLSRQFGRMLLLTMVSLLSAIALSWLLSKYSLAPGYALVLLALVGGMILAVLYTRVSIVPSFLSAVSPAVLAFPVIFLMSGHVAGLLRQQVDPQKIMRPVDATAPVVVIMFDEFPTVSLLDDEHRIDPEVYPNFAALAENATWFRNGSSVHQLTGHAVPAALTGNYQSGNLLPTYGDHPFNLFTLLGGSYELRAFEAFTQLCPTGRFGRFEAESLPERLRATFTDLSVVYLHAVLPGDLTERLPSVSQTWRDFLGPGKEEVDRDANQAFGTQLEHFQEFLDALGPTDKPACYFAHIYLPHQPWVYLPDGRLYMPPNALYMPGYIRDGDRWGPSQYLVDQAFQRHLLQVQLVDRLLGRVIDRLKELDLYDDALIVVTADHGVSFWPNKSRRNPAECPPEDILYVPLLIKAPHQQEAVVSDRNVELIDVLPTMADVLDIELPWQVDGVSALDETVPERSQKRIFTRDGRELTLDPQRQPQDKTLQRKLELFDAGPEGVWRTGQQRDWIGRSVASFRMGDDWPVEFKLSGDLAEWWHVYEYVLVPSLVAGTFQEPPVQDIRLVFAVNGTVEAVVPTFKTDQKTWFSQAMIPPSAFESGENQLEVFAVPSDDVDSPVLHRLHVEPDVLQVAPEAQTAPYPGSSEATTSSP